MNRKTAARLEKLSYGIEMGIVSLLDVSEELRRILRDEFELALPKSNFEGKALRKVK